MPKKLVKPYKTFPLTAHSAGYWCKVIHGKQHLFGTRWCSPEEALADYLQKKSSLDAGTDVSRNFTGATLREGLQLFLDSRKARLIAGAIVQRSYDDYVKESLQLRDLLGATQPLQTIGPAHFTQLRLSMSGTPSVISNRIGRLRVFFKFIYDNGLIDRPVRYGSDFSKPSATEFRLSRADKPKKLYTPEQIHALLALAPPQLHGMIWLGLFCGYGNHDCGTLQVTHLDLPNGWANYHRPKTGVTRKAWLPPEAVTAIRDVSQTSGTVFRTRRGNAWSTEKKKNPIAVEFKKLADACNVKLGFYALRHTCETIGGRAKDQVAMDYIMGHVPPGMSTVYREEIDDSRLRAIGEVIYAWLKPVVIAPT